MSHRDLDAQVILKNIGDTATLSLSNGSSGSFTVKGDGSTGITLKFTSSGDGVTYAPQFMCNASGYATSTPVGCSDTFLYLVTSMTGTVVWESPTIPGINSIKMTLATGATTGGGLKVWPNKSTSPGQLLTPVPNVSLANNIFIAPVIVGAFYNSGINYTPQSLMVDVNSNLLVDPVGTGPQPDTTSISVVNVPTSNPAGGLTYLSSAALEASHVVKASAGCLYGIAVYSSKATTQFIQVFNSTTVPADTAVPLVTFVVGGTNNGYWSAGNGTFPVCFSTGIAVSNSSTAATKTIGAGDTFFMVTYK